MRDFCASLACACVVSLHKTARYKQHKINSDVMYGRFLQTRSSLSDKDNASAKSERERFRVTVANYQEQQVAVKNLKMEYVTLTRVDLLELKTVGNTGNLDAEITVTFST